MRLVLDTNSLIQCVSRRSRYHDLWLSFAEGLNTLCVTTEILDECKVEFPKVDIIGLDEAMKTIIHNK